MHEQEIGTFHTKLGNKCVVTRTQVIWYSPDGSVDQVFIRDIRSVKLSSGGFFSPVYKVEIYKVGESNPENTQFATQTEQEAMANAVQTAMRSFGSI